MIRLEALDRHELPLQSVDEQGQSLKAIVPVHLNILSLRYQERVDRSNLSGAYSTVRRWYDEDMDYHLECLRKDRGTQGTNGMRGYERFSTDWSLGSTMGEGGFLNLTWRESARTRAIGLSRTPVILFNRSDQDHGFHTLDGVMDGKTIEVVYKSIDTPEVVYMDPDKMRQYGKETRRAKIDLEKGVAEVMASAFCSESQNGLAALPKALLLRDYAVFYLNRLLDGWKLRLQ